MPYSTITVDTADNRHRSRSTGPKNATPSRATMIAEAAVARSMKWNRAPDARRHPHGSGQSLLLPAWISTR